MGRLSKHALSVCALACMPSCVPPGVHDRAEPVAIARLVSPQLPVDLGALVSVDEVRRLGQAASRALRLALIAAPSAARRSNLQCLTSALYHEARSEGAAGEKAVAQVVLNRTRDRAYPASICAVVYQKDASGRFCQFTFACDGSERRKLEPSAWRTARDIAKQALAGLAYAPVGKATHYHNRQVQPAWSREMLPVAVIGDHLFYRRAEEPPQMASRPI